jgi:hypothetical protein
MPVTDADFAALAMRVAALEKASVDNTETITWVAGTLGQMKATLDHHTQRLYGIEADISDLRAEVRGLKSDLASQRADLPSIVATSLRSAMRGKEA